MNTRRPTPFLCAALIAGALFASALIAGCGSSSSSGTSAVASTAQPQGSSAAAAGGSGAQAPSEAQAAATGDIPDTQNFLTYKSTAEGYSISYPEGWSQKGSGPKVSFRNNANLISIAVSKGPPPTVASASAGLAKLKQQDPSVTPGKPQQVTIKGTPVIKVTYTSQSAPDPVTGKRLPLLVDRYIYAKNGKVAVVDLETPKGVDNVDAYRMISESFKWL